MTLPRHTPSVGTAPVRRSWKHPARAALLAGLATLVVGCSPALPTDPVPQPGLAVNVQPRQDVQRLLPPPQEGASTTEIVQGFLRANVGFAATDDVARTYLTTGLASDWVPTSQVLVYEGTPQVSATGPGTVAVTVPVTARIGEGGWLTEEPVGRVTSQSFELAQVDGEWRISGFPEGFGLWLSRTDLELAFRESQVHYLNPHLDLFVPDTRWLPRGEGLATSLTRAQLAALPDYLQGAVRTGSSPDVTLAVGAVPVDPVSQVATVNLAGPGLGDDPDRIDQLRAQLGHALLALNGVTAVDVRLGGRSQLGEDDDGAVNAGTDLGYQDVVRTADRALLRRGEEFSVVDPGRYNLPDVVSPAVADLDLPNLSLAWTGVAASAGLEQLAAVSTDGTRMWRWRDGQAYVNEGIGDGLTAPSFDPHGAVWVAGTARGGGDPRAWWVSTSELGGLAKPVQITFLEEDERVTAFRVSPDGTRALMVVEEVGSAEAEGDTAALVGRQRLLVAGIVRDSEGRPTDLAAPLEAAPTLISVTSARWSASDAMFVSGLREQDQRLVAFEVPLGGWLEELGEQSGLVDVQAVPTGQTSTPVVKTDDGRFHTREGSTGWYDARNGDELIIPGA